VVGQQVNRLDELAKWPNDFGRLASPKSHQIAGHLCVWPFKILLRSSDALTNELAANL